MAARALTWRIAGTPCKQNDGGRESRSRRHPSRGARTPCKCTAPGRAHKSSRHRNPYNGAAGGRARKCLSRHTCGTAFYVCRARTCTLATTGAGEAGRNRAQWVSEESRVRLRDDSMKIPVYCMRGVHSLPSPRSDATPFVATALDRDLLVLHDLFRLFCRRRPLVRRRHLRRSTPTVNMCRLGSLY